MSEMRGVVRPEVPPGFGHRRERKVQTVSVSRPGRRGGGGRVPGTRVGVVTRRGRDGEFRGTLRTENPVSYHP